MKKELFQFPITEYIESICAKLKNSAGRSIVLTAETGAGKSTVLPVGLLEQFEGKILMTEPRRLAVLGVANRVASILEEEPGQTAGYKIHLENKTSEKTRLEVVTEAILVRYLQQDPALEDYNLIVLDEFHERSVYTDLALAFLKEAMELRDDLYVIIMSATMNAKKVAEYINGEVIEISGRTFPVSVTYDENRTPAKAVLHALSDKSEKGNILVFLPGIGDIRRVEEELSEDLQDSDVELCVLHSSISLNEQKKVITPIPENAEKQRRVILSSAIAETSLTVPGVTVVIDSGLARVNRMNIATGMGTLVTEVESDFSAEQRKGRAGRTQPGKCIRLWNEFDVRKKEMQPEILRADLTELVLECADRGIYERSSIQWLDFPLESSWNGAVELLKNLKLLKGDGHITEKGRAALGLGMHPRLASVAIEAKVNNLSPDKLLVQYSSYSKSGKEIQNRFIKDVHNRLDKIGTEKLELIKKDCEKISDERLLILAGFPDRLAKRISTRTNGTVEFQFYGGRKAVIAGDGSLWEASNKRDRVNGNRGNSGITGLNWIVAPEVLAGTAEAKIFDYEEIPEQILLNWLNSRTKTVEICSFDNGKILKQEVIKYGEIVISAKKMTASAEDFAAAWCNEVHTKGLDCLPVNEKIQKLIVRAEFYQQQTVTKGTEQKEQTKGTEISVTNRLVNDVEKWLPPFMTGSNKLTEEIVWNGLYWYLEGADLDREVPETITLANGRKCKVVYEKQSSPEDKNKLIIRPVIEIIIQRIFGCFETPKVAGMKVLLKLLSPASRPLQITDDLENFWTGAWPEICKEMKGRYPKHNWDHRQTKGTE